jgi:hypothetical protein
LKEDRESILQGRLKMFEEIGIGETNSSEVLFFFFFPDPMQSLKTINVISYTVEEEGATQLS